MFSRVAAVVLVNNSSVSKTKGTINGVAQSFMSLSRGLSHFCIILIFAWSQNNSGICVHCNFKIKFKLRFSL